MSFSFQFLNTRVPVLRNGTEYLPLAGHQPPIQQINAEKPAPSEKKKRICRPARNARGIRYSNLPQGRMERDFVIRGATRRQTPTTVLRARSDCDFSETPAWQGTHGGWYSQIMEYTSDQIPRIRTFISEVHGCASIFDLFGSGLCPQRNTF
jgi:hypothetical protein